MTEATSAQPLIQVEGLDKVYGRGLARVHALKGVSFTINSGDWVSIIGPSGSGKTTLLNVLGALDRDYQGSVRLAGRELRTLRDRSLSRFRGGTIGFIFQHFNLLPHLSVLENVLVPGIFSPTRVDARRRARALLDRVGLADKARARPLQLSGGQQQRVAIARALFNRVSLLLCDEPTGALDRESGHQIMRIFDSLNRDEGLTIVVVTHERYISEMSKETIRLVDGRVVLSGARFPADSWEESRRLSDQLKAARKASEAGEDRAES